MLDTSGNNRHLTFLGSGSPTYVPTVYGTGLEIGDGEGLDWSTYAALLAHPFTIEMVLTPTKNTTSWSKLFGFDDTDDDGWYYYQSGIQAYPNSVLGSSINANEKHYIAFVSTSSTTMDVYFQGNLLGSTDMAFTAAPTEALFFRDDTDTSRTEQFNGVIEALRISAVSRTSTEIDAVQSNIDATKLEVSSTNLSSSYTTGPNNFTVTFNIDVNNPTGNTDPDDVTNPENYLLIEKGTNGVADTVSCDGGLVSDDTKVIVNSVSYNSTSYTSTITLANSLSQGFYRLFVCGTTSIVDGAGVPLNDGADELYDFTVQAAASSLPTTGFRHGKVTTLPHQPTAKAYTETAMMLEVPKIGVPQTANGWDVTWLGNSAGYLAGSAFPTWAGNTVITGHVWDAYNQPGIFSELKTLSYGDQVQIRAWGLTYTYEVRESKLVTKKNVNAAFQSEEYDWLTLVTCEFYNPFTGDYLFRRAVRAVLVSVK
jgi:LPXTG-site transpeptidase (sortase) family protein